MNNFSEFIRFKLIKIRKWASKSVINLFIFSSIFLGVLLLCLDIIYDTKIEDVVVEAHGLWLDLLIFGILFSIYESLSKKRTEIDTHLDTIEAFREWHEPESKFRIVNSVRKLNMNDVTALPLYECFLDHANLENTNLENAIISGSSMKYVNFSGANLKGAEMTDVDLKYSSLENANFRNADLTASDLRGATFNSQLWESLSALKEYADISNDENDAIILSEKFSSLLKFTEKFRNPYMQNLPLELKLKKWKQVTDKYIEGATLTFAKVNEDQTSILLALGADLTDVIVYPAENKFKD